MKNATRDILIGIAVLEVCCYILMPPIGVFLLVCTIKLGIPALIICGIYSVMKNNKNQEKVTTEIHKELNEIEKSMLEQEKINKITSELDEIEQSLNDRLQREASTDKVTWIWDNHRERP